MWQLHWCIGLCECHVCEQRVHAIGSYNITIVIAHIDAECKSERGTYSRAIGCTISIANSYTYYDADRCILYEQCEGW